MMLRSKTGQISFTARDSATGREWKNLERLATPAQLRTVATRPDIIWQYSQFLKNDFALRGLPEIQIYANALVTLNNNPPQQLIDSTVNLSQGKWYPFRHSTWIKSFHK